MLSIALCTLFILPILPNSFAHKSINQYGHGYDIQANITSIRIHNVTPIVVGQDLTIDYGFVEDGHSAFSDEIRLLNWNWDVTHDWPDIRGVHSSLPPHHYYLHSECEPVGNLKAYAIAYSGGHGMIQTIRDKFRTGTMIDYLKEKAKEKAADTLTDEAKKKLLTTFASEGVQAFAETTESAVGVSVAISDTLTSVLRGISTVDFGYGQTLIDLNHVPEYSDQTIEIPTNDGTLPNHDSVIITFHLRAIYHPEGCSASETRTSTIASSYGMIPSWVKKDATLYSQDSITSQEFATAVAYLVQQKIISTNVATNTDGTISISDNLSIPSWIKNNAKYWSEGSISDTDFTSGIEYMVNQNIISFSGPIYNSGVISNDDLKSLYAISKQYERTTASISTLNDNQEKVLQGLTTSNWYKNTQDPKAAIHAQVLNLLIKKQNMDKQNIQQVLDATSDISNKIKNYAQKQGVSSSELDKIASMPLKNQNPGNTPISVLKQSADDVKNNVAAAKNDKSLSDEDQANLARSLGTALGTDVSPLEQFHNDKLQFTDITAIQSLLENHSQDLTDSEINGLTIILALQGYKAPDQTDEERSKQHILDLMQQAIDLLQREELGETDSILNYIDDKSALDLSPNTKTPSQTASNTNQSSSTGTPPSVSTPNMPGSNSFVNPSPQFISPQNIIQEATSSSGAIVTFIAATMPPSTIITCNHESGTQFPLGNTVVTCNALSSGGSVTKSFTVTVQDTTPPAISPFNPHNDKPDDSGAIVYFTTEAIDLVDGPVLIHCDHQSGTKFPMGDTIVTCTADDSKGNHASRAFKVSITKS